MVHYGLIGGVRMEVSDFLIRILNSRGVPLRKASNREIIFQPEKIIVEKFSSVHKGDITVDSVSISLQQQRLCISHFSKEHTPFPVDCEILSRNGENFQITKKIIETYQVQTNQLHYVRKEETDVLDDNSHRYFENSHQEVYPVSEGFTILDGIDSFVIEKGIHTFKKVFGTKK